MTPGGDVDRLDADPCWRGIDAEACYRYTLSRQTEEGGFCFYAYPEWRVAEPNALDTQAAVAILVCSVRQFRRLRNALPLVDLFRPGPPRLFRGQPLPFPLIDIAAARNGCG